MAPKRMQTATKLDLLVKERKRGSSFSGIRAVRIETLLMGLIKARR
jgi:hypothetical protein